MPPAYEEKGGGGILESIPYGIAEMPSYGGRGHALVSLALDGSPMPTLIDLSSAQPWKRAAAGQRCQIHPRSVVSQQRIAIVRPAI